MVSSSTCVRCHEPVGSEDRYCRSCGYALDGRLDYVQDLNRAIVEGVPMGIFSIDLSSRVRYWNAGMETHTGLKRRDVLGRLLFDSLPYLHPFTHGIMRVFDTALPVRLDQVTHDSGHGTQLTESFWFGPMLLEDGSAALLGVMEDITQKVRVDNQLIRSERLAAIGELAAGVAHNFNNILAAIGGDAQLLKMAAEDEKLPAHVVEAAQQICDETMRGGRIAHDLLSFARGAEPHIQRLDIRELLNDVARLIKNHPSARSVSIDLGIDPELPHVEADPNLLHQVFFNLMLNALQAMPNGGILTISAGMRGHEQDPTAGLLDLKFHDTGVGIPREHVRRVFDPFYSRRAGGSVGSGLGLPVSLAMVKSIGGDIQIASAEGIGTTVTVSLPIVERRTARRGGLRREKKGRALIVDDDANVCRTLTTLLSRRGFEVVTASGGEEAIEEIEAAAGDRALDVVLMELLLPKASGEATARRIRELDPNVPIIILTGVTEPQRLRQALENGAQVAFGKPPNFTELLAVVERLAQAAQDAADAEAGDLSSALSEEQAGS